MSLRYTALLALSLWIASAYSQFSCFAADAMQPLKSAYEQGDYAIVVRLGREITQVHPANALAHYYIGNALVGLSRPGEAAVEYQKCIDINRNDAIGINSAQAILTLRRGPAPRPIVMPEKIIVTKPVVRQTVINEPVTQTQIDLKRLRDVAAREDKLASERYDQEVSQIQRQTSLSDEESKVKTREAFQKFQAEQAKIEGRYKDTAADLHKRGLSTAGETKTNRMVPHGSNAYVQNFENLGGESDDISIPFENPTLAKAKSLSVSRSKTAQVKKSQKSINK